MAPWVPLLRWFRSRNHSSDWDLACRDWGQAGLLGKQIPQFAFVGVSAIGRLRVNQVAINLHFKTSAARGNQIHAFNLAFEG